MLNLPLLSLLILFPIIGIIVTLFLSKNDLNYTIKVKEIGLWTSLLNLILSIILAYNFDKTETNYQFVEHYELLPDLNINYYLGIDGISLPLILLTTFLIPICLITSWKKINHHINYFVICFLLLEVFLIGVFSSLDLFIFYIFFEGALIPLFLIIGIWGYQNRIYASYKFFLYTLIGSLLMLLGILTIYFYVGSSSYTVIEKINFPFLLQIWLFLAFFSSFAVKIPMFPFHTWLPDAHVQAPTAGSIILAGVLLKLGAYGFLRFSLPLFPDASVFFTPFIFTLSIISIIYVSILALAQTNIKKLIAYSSIAHMGFVTLGIFSNNIEGLHGSYFQMISHGLISAALFLSAGSLIDRTENKEIVFYSGVYKKMPIFSLFFLIYILGGIALPGTTGFIGELLVLIGMFKINFLLAFFAGTGMILSACYFLWLYGRIILGETNNRVNKLIDLSKREVFIYFLLMFFIIFLGLYPDFLINTYEITVNKLVVN